MGINIGPIHPAVELAFQIWALIAGIWLVLWVVSKFAQANRMIENAKNIPGGMNYQPEEEDYATEEMKWKAHA